MPLQASGSTLTILPSDPVLIIISTNVVNFVWTLFIVRVFKNISVTGSDSGFS